MEPFLTPEQAAARLQVHPAVVRRWLQRRILPGVKLPGRWRIDPDELRAFIRSGGKRSFQRPAQRDRGAMEPQGER